MILLVASLAAAEAPLTADEAATLGLPRLHHVEPACDCVSLVWSVDGRDRTLELPRATVSGVALRLAEDGLYELWLTSADASELQIERGPCVPIEDLGLRYASKLGTPVDRSGLDDPMCAHVEARLREDLLKFEDQVSKRMVKVAQIDAVAAVTLTDRSGERTAEAVELQRTWRALRPILSHCMTLSEGVSGAEVRLVVRTDGSTTGVKVTHRGTGAEAVDKCLVRTLDNATADPPPARTQRLQVAVAVP